MIYQKKNTPFMRSNAYANCYELMIVFSKGKPKTFNPLKEPTKRHGWETAVSNILVTFEILYATVAIPDSDDSRTERTAYETH